MTRQKSGGGQRNKHDRLWGSPVSIHFQKTGLVDVLAGLVCKAVRVTGHRRRLCPFHTNHRRTKTTGVQQSRTINCTFYRELSLYPSVLQQRNRAYRPLPVAGCLSETEVRKAIKICTAGKTPPHKARVGEGGGGNAQAGIVLTLVKRCRWCLEVVLVRGSSRVRGSEGALRHKTWVCGDSCLWAS